jgi:tryptophanyl-tRNA synthetase
MKKVILTGDRPSGPLHLGHFVGSLDARVKLQHTYEQYILIADTQALTDNFENPDKVIKNVYEVMKDYISVGIDPEISTIFIQSKISAIAELTVYYMNLVTLARLLRNPTVKTEIMQKNFQNDIPAGFLCYPISQAADITAFGAHLVPVGEDQIPMIEQTNEIVRKFNRLYNTDCLVECEAYLSINKRLVGTDGKNKASKSLGNAIFLSDTKDIIKNKVFQMYTDENHLKVSDPGKIEGNVVFDYLSIFHSNKEEVEELKSHYQKGGLGDVTIKNILTKTLCEFLEPIYEKRQSLEDNHVKELLMIGTQKANQKANQKLEEVKNAIGINY